MVHLPADQRRKVILTAAVLLASDRGIWAVTHGTVAKRCDVPTSQRTVRFYYPTKSDLWAATIKCDLTGDLEKQARELGWTAP